MNSQFRFAILEIKSELQDKMVNCKVRILFVTQEFRFINKILILFSYVILQIYLLFFEKLWL